MRAAAVLCGAVLLAGVVACGGGAGKPPAGPAVVVTAEDLGREYGDNEAAADAKYRDKTVEASGKVSRVADGAIEMKGGGGREKVVLVALADPSKLASLKPGQEIRVKGTCYGMWFARVSIKSAVLLD